MLTRAHGRITTEHVERVGKLAGPMGKELDKIFAENIGETYVQSSTHGEEEMRQSVADFVKIYHKANLVTYVGKKASIKWINSGSLPLTEQGRHG